MPCLAGSSVLDNLQQSPTSGSGPPALSFSLEPHTLCLPPETYQLLGLLSHVSFYTGTLCALLPLPYNAQSRDKSLLCVAFQRPKQLQVIHSRQQMQAVHSISENDGHELIRHRGLHNRPRLCMCTKYYLDTLHCVSWDVRLET